MTHKIVMIPGTVRLVPAGANTTRIFSAPPHESGGTVTPIDGTTPQPHNSKLSRSVADQVPVPVPRPATSWVNPPLTVTVIGCVENTPIPVIASVSPFDAIATFGTSTCSSHVPLPLFGSAAALPGATATR